MNSRIDELTRLIHADPENQAVRARLVAERKRVFGHSNFEGSLLNPYDLFSFVLAGRAKFTLESTKSGKHLTFRVKQKTTKIVENGVKRTIKHPFWYVSVMTGTDNNTNYQPLGTIDGDDRVFKIAGGQFTRQDPPYLAFRYMWRHAKLVKAAPSLRVWHHGSCGCCARTLSVPESVKTGLGPICSGRINKSKRAKLKSKSLEDQKRFERTFLSLIGAA